MASKWSLKPLPSAKRAPLKTLLSSSIPLIINLFLQGMTKEMEYLLIGLLLGAVWVSVSVWPLAKSLSIEIVNRRNFTKQRYSSTMPAMAIAQSRIELNRKLLFWGIRSIVFVVLCAFVVLALSSATAHVVNRHYADERTDAYNHLDMMPAVSDTRGLTAGWVDVVNHSEVDVRIQFFNCKVNSLSTESNQLFSLPGGIILSEGMTLEHGGDGHSFPCLPGGFFAPVPATSVNCADLRWDIKYVLLDQPKQLQTKAVRYALLPGTKNWGQLSLDSEQIHCPHISPK